MNELDEFTEEKILVEYIDTNPLLEDRIHLSREGIYCYDIYAKVTKFIQEMKKQEKQVLKK